MYPATSERNFTPSSTELSAPASTSFGTAVAGQMLVVDGAAATTMLSVFEMLCAGLPESPTRTVKLKVPAELGVPVIAPPPALSASPVGKAPAAMFHV